MKKPIIFTRVLMLAACLFVFISSGSAQRIPPPQHMVFPPPSGAGHFATCSDAPEPIVLQPTVNPVPVNVTLSGGKAYDGYKNTNSYNNYATHNTSFITGCNGNNFAPQINIQFSQPVSRVAVGLGNGVTKAMVVTATSNAGTSSSVLLPAFYWDGSPGDGTLIIGGSNITSVILTVNPSAAGGNWDFLIYNISFTLQTSVTSAVASPFKRPQATDTTFVSPDQPSLNTGCTYRSGGPLKIKIPISRVISDASESGTPPPFESLISNGFISPYATLRMPAFDVNYNDIGPTYQPERDHVIVNGINIGPLGTYLKGQGEKWVMNEIQVPISYLRFGKRNRGGLPTPGDNEIEIQIDEANINSFQDRWCTSIAWASLQFDAIAPVVMIHGNNSNGQFFENFDFVKPFKDYSIPYDNTITMETDSRAVHAQLLDTLIRARAAEFGVKHVHLVAHSKGGLDSREFLENLVCNGTTTGLGVLSLITLSTPHHGSVGVDYELLVDDPRVSVFASEDSDNFIRATLMWLYILKNPPSRDRGHPDLRPSAAREFNSRNLPNLPLSLTVDGETKPVQYFTFGSDADVDNSRLQGFPIPIITYDEIAGSGMDFFGSQVVAAPYVAFAVEQAYRLLGEVSSVDLGVHVHPAHTVVQEDGTTLDVPEYRTYYVKETRNSEFKLNDFLVTQESSKMPSPFIAQPMTKANHATIANPGIGQMVVNLIRSIQPIR
jgi:hypothetical protein